MIDNVALAAFILILLIARFFFVRDRRKLPVYSEWKIAKGRLPYWVRACEKLAQLFFLITLFLLLAAGFLLLRFAWHSNNIALPDDAAWLIFLPSLVAAIIPAFLLTNLLSWSLPPLRTANNRAFQNLPTVSYSLANRELVQAGMILVPYCLVFVGLGVFQPWGN